MAVYLGILIPVKSIISYLLGIAAMILFCYINILTYFDTSIQSKLKNR